MLLRMHGYDLTITNKPATEMTHVRTTVFCQYVDFIFGHHPNVFACNVSLETKVFMRFMPVMHVIKRPLAIFRFSNISYFLEMENCLAKCSTISFLRIEWLQVNDLLIQRSCHQTQFQWWQSANKSHWVNRVLARGCNKITKLITAMSNASKNYP